MKITCRHGFFIIRDETTVDVQQFSNIFGLPIVPFKDYWTFPALVSAPGYSIIGNAYLGVTATAAYEGEPWEIMRANKIVYDFNTGVAKAIESVSEVLLLQSANYYYLSNGLLVPGSRRDDGKRVTDYSARFDSTSQTFRYNEVLCE